MGKVLSRNSDERINFECRLVTSPGLDSVTQAFLRQKWREVFQHFRDDLLFYFSGHGTPTEIGGRIVTLDGEPDERGLPMADVLYMACNSSSRNVLLVLACCCSVGS